MAVRAPTTRTIGEELDEFLEDAIIEGRLRPGERIIAEDLAEQFGISRIPVRESLRALGAAGWVEIRARRGVYVRNWSRNELEELFEVRVLLESEAARLAALRRTDGQLRTMRDNLERFERATALTDAEAPEVNRQFHQLVADAAANPVLADLVHRVGKRVKWYFATVTVTRSGESASEHRQIVGAIERHDASRAASLMRAHVGRTRAAVAHVLEDLEEIE
jgi:DNA-binding GntR family transcriptional regulator